MGPNVRVPYQFPLQSSSPSALLAGLFVRSWQIEATLTLRVRYSFAELLALDAKGIPLRPRLSPAEALAGIR